MKRQSTALVAAGLMILCGCGDMKQLGVLLESARKANATMALLAGSVEDYCLQQQRRRISSRAALNLADEDERACASSAEAKKALLGMNKMLVAYWDAAGKLASNKAVLDKSASGLVGAIQKPLGLKEDQAKAIESVANMIGRAATEGFRRRELKVLFRDADEAMGKSLETVTRVLDAQLGTKIEATEGAVRSYYRTGLAAQNDALAESIVSRLWIQQAERELGKLRAQREAVGEYARVLGKLRAVHGKLNAAGGNFGDARLASEMEDLAKELDESREAVEAAFQKQ